MHPIIARLGPITIYSYGLMIAVAFIAAAYLSQKNAKNKGIPPQKIVDLGLILVVSGIIGARFFYILSDIKGYIKNPLEIFMIHHGGLAIYGGIIFGSLAGFIFLVKNRLAALKVADICIPYVALGQAIGRIGCLLNGCCYGKPAGSILGICLPGNSYPVHPTQIYSSIGMIALFITLRLFQDKLKQGSVFILYLILYAAIRFSIDFLRGDLTQVIWGLTGYQIISAVIFIIAVPILIIREKNK